ncbi:DUF6223 family protein [Longitalea luteola]|uniref:DUF6223 family protein n=1 Tax=Longitalea luteola TaxID=2812563 RepID=UPI001A96E0D2|nr:DUF6223 family protein [Longitalea luteola]
MQTLLQMDMLLQVSGITPGRAAALLPAVMGLISVVFGCMALARVKRNSPSGRAMAIAAIILALMGIVFSGLHLARATGAIGTGSGRLGAIVALLFSLIGVVISWLALARFRRMARD